MPRHSGYYDEDDLEDYNYDEEEEDEEYYQNNEDSEQQEYEALKIQLLNTLQRETTDEIFDTIFEIYPNLNENDTFLQNLLIKNNFLIKNTIQEIYSLAKEEKLKKKKNEVTFTISSKKGNKKGNTQVTSSTNKGNNLKGSKNRNDENRNVILVNDIQTKEVLEGTAVTNLPNLEESLLPKKEELIIKKEDTKNVEGELLKAMGRGSRMINNNNLNNNLNSGGIGGSVGGGRGRGLSLLNNNNSTVTTTTTTTSNGININNNSNTNTTNTISNTGGRGRGLSFLSSSSTTNNIGNNTTTNCNTINTTTTTTVLTNNNNNNTLNNNVILSVPLQSTIQESNIINNEVISDTNVPTATISNNNNNSNDISTIPTFNQTIVSAFGKCLISNLTNEQFVNSFFSKSPERLSPYYDILNNNNTNHTTFNNTKNNLTTHNIESLMEQQFKLIFQTPSPDDLILTARSQHKTSHQPIFTPIQKKQSSNDKSGNDTKSGIDTKSSKVGTSTTPNIEPSSPKTPLTPSTPTFGTSSKKKVSQIVPPEDKEKKRINVVIIGHVDAGKSTLMGHLLYKLGNVSDKLIHKFKKESQEIGKTSFHFAWILDENQEERQRGITMDVGVRYFETKNRNVTILDAPGHKDFIPRMITGASQADFAILVIDSSPDAFETGFKAGGQTKEHLLLARSLGVEQVIVAINKLDLLNWSKERFDQIVNELNDYMKQIGFVTPTDNIPVDNNKSNVIYIPCSGLQGENLVEKSTIKELQLWYKNGPTIVEQIDKFEPKARDIEKALRLSISDVYKAIQTGITIAGKIETGVISEGDELVIMPIMERCQVKCILRHKQFIKHAYAGDNVEIGLQNTIDIQKLMIGQILCPPGKEIKVTDKFKCRILTFDMKRPLLKGSQIILHLHNIDVPATITKMVCTLNKQQEVIQKRPRCLLKSTNAIIEITTEVPISIEKYSDFPKFGRLTIRVNGETVAAGVVTDILNLTNNLQVTTISGDDNFI
ncbi:hypothetical protein ABK040_010512 [Willaertia magna]